MKEYAVSHTPAFSKGINNMHNNDRTHPAPDFLHMKHIHYSCVSSSQRSDGWMDGWMGLLEQRAWPLRLLFFEDDDARHAETLLSLTSGQRRCNLTAPNPEAPLAGDPFPFIYFFC